MELKGEQFHALIPRSSIDLVMLGPNGRITSTTALQQTFRGRGRGGVAAPEDFIRALRAGRVGPVAARREDVAEAAKAKTLVVFHLKFVKAEEVLKILKAVYPKEADLRVSADARLNSVIVQADEALMKDVETLLKKLDVKTY